MDSKKIRQQIKASGLFQWQVADEVGVNEVTFIRWLRKPLPEEKKRAVLEAIQRLSTKQKGGYVDGKDANDN